MIDLDNLSKEDLKKIVGLISDLTNKSDIVIEEPVLKKTKRKRVRKKKKSKTVSSNSVPKLNTRNSKRIKKGVKRLGSQEGSPARIEPFDTSGNRPNLFLEKGMYTWDKGRKQDIEIDKKLSGSNELTPRNIRQDMVEVECQVCQQYFVVNQTLVYQDREKVHFTCNSCQRNNRR